MLEWLKEHWIWAIFMVLAASALISHFILHLEWPKRVLTYVSVVPEVFVDFDEDDLPF